MEDFPGNPRNPKQETAKNDPTKPMRTNKAVAKKVTAEKEVKKVVVGEVKQHKTPFFKRVKATLFSNDFSGIAHYISSEVLIPAFKNMAVDTVTKGIERAMFGDAPSRRQQQGTRYSYNNPLNTTSRPYSGNRQQPSQPPRGRRHTVGNIVLTSKTDAERVLETLSEIVEKYDVASVADLYDLLGYPTTYIDNNWGWHELVFANIHQTRAGFLLDLPPTEPL